MGAVYATAADLKKHWDEMPDGVDSVADQKLMEASIEVRVNYPGLDGRLLRGALDAEVPRLVVCRMVKRAMDVDDDDAVSTAGFDSMQFGTGPFTIGGKVHNPDGNIYMSASDKRLLLPPRDGRIFSSQPGRPPWAS